MQRVIVIGSGGAGKSAFSKQLAALTRLPLHHLDALYWQPGWVEPAKDEWRAQMGALVAEPRWILDGNFGGTLAPRLLACDTVIFMDTPAWVCVWRVVLRRIRHHGGTRPDMRAGCTERLNAEFIAWILGYPFRQRPQILRRLKTLRPDQTVVVLRSTTDAETYLQTIHTQCQQSLGIE